VGGGIVNKNTGGLHKLAPGVRRLRARENGKKSGHIRGQKVHPPVRCRGARILMGVGGEQM